MLTDNQMMLLEQLTYLDIKVAESAGVAYTGAADVREMMSVYTEDVLAELEKIPADGLYTTGQEYAAIIRAIQSDPELMALKLTAYNETEGIFCYEDPSHPDEAVVAFCGTRGAPEWQDNFEGLTETDTLHQKRALDFIENLDYEHVSVVGHSKGGNKAQYVTLLSDKVDNCVSMDGQGFSNEFLEKYSSEISERADKIKNYSLDTDYVHILMNPVPGSTQIYCAGDSDKSGVRNHAPCAYYSFYVDENGNSQLARNKDGEPLVQVGVKENEMMSYLNQFTCFILNTMPTDKKKQLAEYLGNIMAMTRDSTYYFVGGNGVVYTKENLFAYILSDKESAEILLAYLAKYVKTYGLTEAQLRELLAAFGCEELIDKLYEWVDEKTLGIVSGGEDTGELAIWLLNQLADGKNDIIVTALLALISPKLSSWASDEIGEDVEIDLSEIWKGTEKEYESIPEVKSPETANKPKTVSGGVAMDFSSRAYGMLSGSIDAQIRNAFPQLNWSSFAREDWYGSLGVDSIKNKINFYGPYLDAVEKRSKNNMENVFDDEWDIDTAGAHKIADEAERMQYAANLLKLTLRPLSIGYLPRQLNTLFMLNKAAPGMNDKLHVLKRLVTNNLHK